MDLSCPLDVIIVGGSLAGLMHGIILTRRGHNVRILDRSQNDDREYQGGAGIGTGTEGKRFISAFDESERPYSFASPRFSYLDEDGKVHEKRKFAMNLTSWVVLYYRLRWLFDGTLNEYNPVPRRPNDGEGKAIMQLGARVLEVRQAEPGSEKKMKVILSDSQTSQSHSLVADLVIDASGFGSEIRKALLGDVPVSYEGVVGLRGTVPETSVSDETLAVFDERAEYNLVFSPREGHYVVGYLIPGLNGSLKKGDRLINYVWYKPLSEGSEAWNKTGTITVE